MMTSSKQRKFTFNSLLEDTRGSKCCVIKVRQKQGDCLDVTDVISEKIYFTHVSI